MGETTRRKYEIKLPKTSEEIYVNLSSDEPMVFEDEEMTKQVAVKGGVELEISIPKNIEFLEVRRAKTLPAIVSLSLNRTLWPIEGATGLKFIMDNRNIDMIKDGEFRMEKYHQLCSAVAWKRWVLLVYQYEDGTEKAILWWK